MKILFLPLIKFKFAKKEKIKEGCFKRFFTCEAQRDLFRAMFNEKYLFDAHRGI